MLATNIHNKLKILIPDPITELNYSNNFELMIAVILSAQCTDKRVNIITKNLFKKYPTPEKLASAKIEEVEEIIYSCNYYKSKAKNIISASKKLVQEFNSVVPSSREQLMQLDGVGRKTANVILAVGFNIPSFAVDTHVFRVANRLGLTKAKNVKQSEEQLTQLVKKDNWISMHHYLILFGRYYCKAQNPSCKNCVLKEECVWIKNNKKKN